MFKILVLDSNGLYTVYNKKKNIDKKCFNLNNSYKLKNDIGEIIINSENYILNEILDDVKIFELDIEYYFIHKDYNKYKLCEINNHITRLDDIYLNNTSKFFDYINQYDSIKDSLNIKNSLYTTLFIPTNNAFDSLEPNILQFLKDNPSELINLLNYHIYDSSLFVSQMRNGLSLRMRNNQILYFENNNDNPTPNFIIRPDGSSKIPEVNIKKSRRAIILSSKNGCNLYYNANQYPKYYSIKSDIGIIHIIDNVLIPEILINKLPKNKNTLYTYSRKCYKMKEGQYSCDSSEQECWSNYPDECIDYPLSETNVGYCCGGKNIPPEPPTPEPPTPEPPTPNFPIYDASSEIYTNTIDIIGYIGAGGCLPGEANWNFRKIADYYNVIVFAFFNSNININSIDNKWLEWRDIPDPWGRRKQLIMSMGGANGKDVWNIMQNSYILKSMLSDNNGVRPILDGIDIDIEGQDTVNAFPFLQLNEWINNLPKSQITGYKPSITLVPEYYGPYVGTRGKYSPVISNKENLSWIAPQFYNNSIDTNAFEGMPSLNGGLYWAKQPEQVFIAIKQLQKHYNLNDNQIGFLTPANTCGADDDHATARPPEDDIRWDMTNLAELIKKYNITRVGNWDITYDKYIGINDETKSYPWAGTLAHLLLPKLKNKEEYYLPFEYDKHKGSIVSAGGAPNGDPYSVCCLRNCSIKI